MLTSTAVVEKTVATNTVRHLPPTSRPHSFGRLAELKQRIEWCQKELERASHERNRLIFELKNAGMSAKAVCSAADITYSRLYQIIEQAKKNGPQPATQHVVCIAAIATSAT